MNRSDLITLLEQVRGGEIHPQAAAETLARAPYEEDLGFAVLDHHRAIRRGLPEVVYGAGKSAEQLASLLVHLRDRDQNGLATRIDAEKAAAVQALVPEVVYHALPRLLTLTPRPIKARGRGYLAVVTAGTSDLAVSEEAAVTAEFFGNRVERINDVGVAGLHRLLHRLPLLRGAEALIVVAGMEGALPSVVAGLVERPVIAVPTSVGYGANLGGVAALLAMLNSCASGVTVVNIDNGFGAAYAATLMNRDEPQ